MSGSYIQSIRVDWDEIDGDSYLNNISAIKEMNKLDFNKNITFFVGENGTGKSTLIEAIAVAYGFNPEGGTMNYRFSTFDDVSELSSAIRMVKGYKRPKSNYFFRAESFFNVASKAEDYRDQPKEIYYARYGGKSLHEQSHGESFLAYFQSFEKEGIYIMDEPEAALSPQRQLTLFIQIAKMAKNGSQFIIATHSPILLGIPGADIFSFDQGELHKSELEETESYQVMEMFINNRDMLVNQLLQD
ncbi:AAA family ATPase [Anaeromicropila herbilytica]|uniref:ABC transporter ATP-binding protein n=1 Tax=Anaeromicropila herbilytica TaxID=2785025 RepID=A0A7R7EI26_9FIRM|nr:AAA family ATPase [Anaeromicropila herbilytica]BCN29261.1 ABC transporter ATP-binding protein [Anaeromicropila herbilytica]